MKNQYANELAEGTRVDATFALRSKEMRAARTGDAYLALELADRTGQASAVLFRPSAEAAAIPVGSVVNARGTVTSFRGRKRVSLESMRPASRWDAEDLLAASPRSTAEMAGEFKEMVVGVVDPEMRRVLTAVFGDKDLYARFCVSPASQSYHHAYLGGLLEHTIAVARICRGLGRQYPEIDADLLVAAALLHDVGKCDELTYDTAIEFSDEGRLLGHVVLGVVRVREAVAKHHVKIDAARLARLEHAMLSHHGELEWGAPKRPSTFEALLLHHADNLDAKAAGFSAVLAGAARADELWTDSANLFRRPLYAPRPAEDDRPCRPLEDVATHKLTA